MDRELAEIRIGLPTHRLHHGARRAMVAHQVREQRSGEAPPVHRRLGPERREQHVTLVEPAFVGAEHEQHLFPVIDEIGDLIMSWDRVFELPNERVRTLFDPFAEAYAG